MATLDYQVKTETFEGPLELLLELVEKRKLFINEISLAKIADEYIAKLKEFQTLPVETVSNFLIVASTLVLIKSKSLLPTLSLTQEEQSDIKDLEDRLREYQRIRELSLHVKKRFGETILFSKGQPRTREVRFTPSAEITTTSIMSSMRNVMVNLPRKIPLPNVVVRKVISIEEMMERLTTRITSNLKLNFKEFSGMGKEDRVHIIVSFLAMLELVKQGVIGVTQETHGGDIHMETKRLDTPHYGAVV